MLVIWRSPFRKHYIWSLFVTIGSHDMNFRFWSLFYNTAKCQSHLLAVCNISSYWSCNQQQSHLFYIAAVIFNINVHAVMVSSLRCCRRCWQWRHTVEFEPWTASGQQFDKVCFCLLFVSWRNTLVLVVIRDYFILFKIWMLRFADRYIKVVCIHKSSIHL